MLDFDYQLRRTALTGNLRVTIKNGQVLVSAPKFMSITQIERFLAQKSTWIKKNLARSQKSSKNTPQQVIIFGKTYHKNIGYWPEVKLGVSIIGDQLHINLPHPQNLNSAEAKLVDFLKLNAESYIRRRTPQLAEQMKLTGHYRRICLKKQSTVWGSCSSNHNLNFNWTLVHYPPAVIDYVIIHELAHLVEMNHSPRFWALVAQFDPAYKTHRRQLKN